MANGNRSVRPLAVTMGDPAGIGPEIVVKAWMSSPELAGRQAVIVGDASCIRRAARWLARGGDSWPVMVLSSVDELVDLPPRCLPVLQAVDAAPAPEVGKVSAVAGRMAAQSVVWAAQAALRGEVCALVTAPLNKEALAAADLPEAVYPGHTEMLQALAARHLGLSVKDVPVRMMLSNDELSIVLVSIHVSLSDAIDAVTFEQVLQTIRISDSALRQLLGRAPRIAVSGLNPHAGENGLFGREEIEVIAPAVAAAQMEGLLATGPYPPDTVFMRARNAAGHLGEFDVVVAMYHDQGLIPVKYLGVERGVNVTLGLPLIRTSPDHGTAFDIAGQGRADPSSLLAAIRWALKMTS